MITVNTRLTEVETTQVADQTAFTNQIATLNGRVTQLELEIGAFRLSNGFVNQFI